MCRIRTFARYWKPLKSSARPIPPSSPHDNHSMSKPQKPKIKNNEMTRNAKTKNSSALSFHRPFCPILSRVAILNAIELTNS